MNHQHMAPVRVGKPEMEWPVLQHLKSNHHRDLKHGGIRDPEHARLMLLQEHHLPLRAM